MRSLAEWERIVPDQCPDCKGKLGRLEFYPHLAGWEVQDFGRMWLYRYCRKCHNDWAIWKLGVPRE